MFTVLTGAQFGDEGKGKIVDLMSKDYDIIVRFQGGDNAGHTVTVGDDVYKLHLIPSGFLYNARVLIGPGVVLNPEVLADEIDMLEKSGCNVEPEKLGVDSKTSVIMPYHIELDNLRESALTEKIGTTKRGIGFAYVDKVARNEIQFSDLTDKNKLMEKLSELAPQKKNDIKFLGGDSSIVMDEELIDKYVRLGKKLEPYMADVSYEANKAIDDGKSVMAEGAQGTHLDVIHGTQKYVTSSSTIAGSACSSIGVGPTKVTNVLGIVKSYITRVGEGPLPTELNDEVGKHFQDVGREFGTTTGRPRRCGWIDLPLILKSINLNGYTGIALTKLDVLSELDPIKICVGYKLDGEYMEYPPHLTSDLSRCEPVYEELPGWKQDLTHVTEFGDLPEEAQKYVKRLEELMGVPVEYISVGPGRAQTFKNL
ncbi:adenylosuccinate synthase [Methanohalobium sp.]|uniref:adenylosuccinate synthase n=1 Tax=Methanohalobium sp. TaxID=2837493 RepID=UPI0025D5FBEB|nr:adenylosuccinate synthase [Methanohalobium sp.]